MGRPGIASRPGVERQGAAGLEYSAESPSVPDLQESDVSAESLADFPANVPIVKVDEFDEASFDETAPFIVRGAAKRASKKWTDKWLLQRFGSGNFRVCLDSRPALRPFKKHMALAEYFDSLEKSKGSDHPPEYLFHAWLERDFEGVADLLLEDVEVPAAILGLGEPTKWRFFVGPALSGTLPHHHAYAINALARGRKRWAIYAGADPAKTAQLLEEGYRDYNSSAQAVDWFLTECPKLRSRQGVRLWELAQEPGDLVYIPDLFIHAVLNLEPVVGVGVEFFQTQTLPTDGTTDTAMALAENAARDGGEVWFLAPLADRE
jgi:hypothetical protein